jgi:hypothetical protein
MSDKKTVDVETLSSPKEEVVNAAAIMTAKLPNKDKESVREALANKMSGKVAIIPLYELAWPLNKDEFKMGNEKFIKYNGAGETLVPTSKKTMYIIDFSNEEAEILEEMLELPRLTLSKQISNQYWSTEGRIMINPVSDQLDLSIPMDYIKYCVLRGHKRVANSEAERDQWPFAQWVMSNAHEVQSNHNKFHEVRAEAYEKFSKFSDGERRKLAYILGHNVQDMNDNDVNEILYTMIDATPAEFIKATEMPHKAERTLLQKLISTGVARESNNGIEYGDHFLGATRALAAAFLADPKNQNMKIQFERMVQGV